jgi:hypothetical protein
MTFAGVAIETVADGLVNEMHVGLKGTMNALFLKNLALKVHRGMAGVVREGGMPVALLTATGLSKAIRAVSKLWSRRPRSFGEFSATTLLANRPA